MIPALMPFVPKHIRDQDWFIPAVTAWFSIANIILRVITTEALSLTRGKDEKDSAA